MIGVYFSGTGKSRHMEREKGFYYCNHGAFQR